MSFLDTKGIRHLDTSGALEEQVAQGRFIYPRDWNGHPTGAGYGAIAGAIHAARERSEPRSGD